MSGQLGHIVQDTISTPAARGSHCYKLVKLNNGELADGEDLLAGVGAAVPQCGPRLHPNLSNVMKTLTLCRRVVAGLGLAGLGWAEAAHFAARHNSADSS